MKIFYLIVKSLSFYILLLFSMNVFASSSIHVQPLQNVTTYTPTHSIPSVEVPNANYGALPLCPTASALNCPNINGSLPHAGPANCPDVCRVEAVVTKFPSSDLMLMNYIPATCPVDYSTSLSYSYGKEIYYKTTPTDLPFPIPNKATFDSYQIPTVTCSLRVNGGFNHCQTGTADYRVGMTGVYNGGYGMILNDGRTNLCYDQYSCPGTMPLSCSLSTTLRLYQVKYSWYVCTASAGYFYDSSRVMPYNKVCVHHSMKWENSR